ncbi:MAG: hypothetical protein KAJ10_03600 [Thermodesulfovibrionia bacterium]|nr:hypothetical protein [Thermodesulfovibrionia bacterium]
MTTNALVGYDTLMDVVNQYTSQDGNAAYVEAAKTLSRKIPLIRMLPMMPSNQIMSDIGSRDSFLPTPGTRRFNEPIAPTASHTKPFTEPIAMVEDYSEVDYALWKIQNDPNRWRSGRDMRKVEAMGQKADDLLLYGALETDPGAIEGFLSRFNSTTRRPNDDSTWPYHVLDGGGDGSDTASILVLQFGEGKVSGLYPKNSVGGLQIEDLGKSTKEVTVSGIVKMMEVLRTHFMWSFGLKVEDERSVQRIANIEVSGTENIFDEDLLITAINNLPDGGQDPSTTIFVPRAIKTQFDIRAKDKNNVQYGPSEVWGQNVTMFRGIPVMLDEMMDETETAI